MAYKLLANRFMNELKLSVTKTSGFSAGFSTSAVRNDMGFIGLGNMGGHMAANLIKNENDLMVFDVNKEAVQLAVNAGATAAESPAEVAAHCTKIVTMLPSSPHVKEVYCGADGLLTRAKPGTLFLDSSTIDPSVSVLMEKMARSRQAVYMDAPVSGGIMAARDALLTFMVGGQYASFHPAEMVLKQMGRNIVHCGDVGTGQAAKICNNMLLAISMMGTAETINLGIKLGLDPAMLSKILNMSSGRCWSSEVYNPCPGVLPGVPASNDYKGGFGTALMTKDLGLAQNAATEVKAATPLGSLVHQLYRIMTNGEYAQKDFSSAFKFIQQMQEKE